MVGRAPGTRITREGWETRNVDNQQSARISFTTGPTSLMGGNEGRRCMARKGTLRQSQIQGTRVLGRVSISIVDNNQIETPSRIGQPSNEICRIPSVF